MYPACILVSQMNLNAMLSYLELAIYIGTYVVELCPQGVTYTHYFEIRIPDKTYRQNTCILGASLVSLWIHINIKIHRLISIHVSWTRMDPERYVFEKQDTCGIHAGYMYLQR